MRRKTQYLDGGTVEFTEATEGATRFTVDCYGQQTRYSTYRVPENGTTRVTESAGFVHGSGITIPDCSLDLMIRALEHMRELREREAAERSGHEVVERYADTDEGVVLAESLEARHGDTPGRAAA